MRLDDFLTTSTAGFFYIGAKDGSGFFCMGSKAEIFDELNYQEKQAEIRRKKRMDVLKNDTIEHDMHMVKTYQCRLGRLNDEYNALKRAHLAARRTTEKKNIRGKMNVVKSKLEYNNNGLQNAKQRLEERKEQGEKVHRDAVKWKPYAEREVVETYATLQHDPAGIIVLCTGEENGRWWFYDEYIRG